VILSVAKYASPDGKKFEDDAVTPATLVASALDNFDDVSTPAPGPTGQPSAIPKKAPVAPDDQLNKALDMLKAKAA
jgi:carboxyl-terminal processing protease